jgi:hypothetical protein
MQSMKNASFDKIMVCLNRMPENILKLILLLEYMQPYTQKMLNYPG